MNDPIKVIWKYKNNNRRTQYLMNIFIGEVSSNIMKVLKKIETLNFYDTLINLSKDEYNILEKKYGEYWYNYFFNVYHITSSIYLIKESKVQESELIDLYSKEWYDIHIKKNTLIEKKLIYSYESLINDDLKRKLKKKIKETAIVDIDLDKDFTTNKKISIDSILKKKFQQQRGKSKNKLKGGFNDDDYGETIKDDEKEQDEKEQEEKGEPEENIDDELDLDIELPEEPQDEEEAVDLEEIEQLYKDVDVSYDKELSKTTELIKKALDDNRIFQKKMNNMIEFDKSKMNNVYDETLKDIYTKIFVTVNYIYKDDTIKIIKDKICCSLKNSDQFGESSYIIPSRQYLWTEYYYNNNIEKVMVGQKWLRRNEMLNVDIEPNNNLHVYEEVDNQLKNLRDNMKRYTSKIRREDDDTNILLDYEDYIMNNEIYLLDIYNELGISYSGSVEAVKNLTDIYFKLYFPKIRQDEIKDIIVYLNNDKKTEEVRMKNIFETINNDLIIENEIMNVVENTNLTLEGKKNFKDTYVIQSIIHVKLRLKEGSKIDLYRIFNEFVVNSSYPFILYQTIDSNIVYKFHNETVTKYMNKQETTDVITKWFENTPYGITVKFPISDRFGDRFLSVTINESGRLEYKMVWKEDDKAVIEDIGLSFPIIKNLISKINSEKNHQRFYNPEDTEFIYAFINTVQKFELPEKFNINHNDLSEFSRYFYPYIALVIEPRKRQSKITATNNVSKYGTYLRFKRQSKYDNQTKIEMRILHFFRNYDVTDKVLATEISKQFNITEDRALEEVEKIKQRYPYLKKSRKVLKKFESLPKYKSPGIGIDIQGKQRDNYKIRISGARNKIQLDRMARFMNVLLFLYIETYLYKKPERQNLKDKLKELNKIAKRRNKVQDISFVSDEIKTVKKMAKMDKQRIGYKPQEGETQWTRCCQNSGDGKRRRPNQYNAESMAELLKSGYKLNKKTDQYEKMVFVKNTKSGKKEEIQLKTLKFAEFNPDGEPTGNEIHYTCDPEINGEHFYVGFLTRCKNPYGHCMPCCFKKNPEDSKNTNKQDFYSQCKGVESKQEKVTKLEESNILEKLYILQDTNKIQEGRFGLLPRYLDFYFNFLNNRDKFIKQHYLTKTTDNGFFFKYGSVQNDNPFLNAVGSCIDMTSNDIMEKIIGALENDRSKQIYISLNTGDIATQFGQIENFISYLNNNNKLDFELLNNLISIPNILLKGGINIILFQKKTTIIKKSFEKEKVKEDFNLICQNIEDIYSLEDKNRKTIIIIKDGKNYFPIVLVKKLNEDDKTMIIEKIFTPEHQIMKQIQKIYIENCKGSFLDKIVYKDSAPVANEIYFYIQKLDKYKIRFQVVDSRNKTNFFVTDDNFLIPVRPSGAIYNIQIVKSIDKYIQSFKKTYTYITELFKESKELIPVKIIGVYYENEKDTKIEIKSLVTITMNTIPVIEEWIDKSEFDKLKLSYSKAPIIEKIDDEIIKRKFNVKTDKRVLDVNLDEYLNESYELFRLELSNYLNKFENSNLKEKTMKIINSIKLNYEEKVDNIRLILFKLANHDLYLKYKTIINDKGENEDELAEIEVDEDAAKEQEDGIGIANNQQGGKFDKLVHIANSLPDIKQYSIDNDRTSCLNNKTKDQCNLNTHCHFTRTGCYMSITKKELIKFINKISEELATNDRKAYEILKINDYFVSDIVDFNKYTERSDQTILRYSGSNVKKILSDIFGKDNIPQIGKKKTAKTLETNINQINEENVLQNMKEYYLQRLIQNNMTIFRAYVNGFYWIKNEYNDIEAKNLGYYSQIQTDLSSHFKASVIDFLLNDKNKKFIDEELSSHIGHNKIKSYITKVLSDSATITDTFLELYILNKITKSIPIVIYNSDNHILFIFDNGNIVNLKEQDKYKSNSKCINIRYTYFTNNFKPGFLTEIPSIIETLYFI